MAKLHIACVGAGYFAPFHLEAWQRIPEVEVVAICDKDLVKAQELGKIYGIDSLYGNFETLCQNKSFEIVDIITPPATHLELCKQASKAGKHIICQKPLAPTLSEAEQIVTLTKSAGIRFMVHENFRFQPWYRQIKTLWKGGAIGDRLHTLRLHMRMGDGWGKDAYLNRQPYFRSMPRMLMYETGIHYVDVFRYLIGEIQSVYARLRTLNPVITGEDCGLVIFDFNNGGQGILDGNRYNEPAFDNPRYTFGETTLEANQGTIRLYPDGTLTVQPLGKTEAHFSYFHEDRGFAGDCVYYTQRHFVDAFLHDLPFETNGLDYLKNLHVLEAIYESHQLRKDVEVKTKR